jgi:hypothetical protein
VKLGTLTISLTENSAFSARLFDGAWALQLGRLSLQYLRIESWELFAAYAGETQNLEELVEHRVSERGV